MLSARRGTHTYMGSSVNFEEQDLGDDLRERIRQALERFQRDFGEQDEDDLRESFLQALEDGDLITGLDPWFYDADDNSCRAATMRTDDEMVTDIDDYRTITWMKRGDEEMKMRNAADDACCAATMRTGDEPVKDLDYYRDYLYTVTEELKMRDRGDEELKMRDDEERKTDDEEEAHGGLGAKDTDGTGHKEERGCVAPFQN